MKKIILDEAKVLRLYKEGLTSEEIGKKLGCSKIPVLRILKANNISNAARKEAATKAREAQRLAKEQTQLERQAFLDPEKIIAFYKSHTLKETAKEFKAGQATIRQICEENGFIKESFKWSDWTDETKKKAAESRKKTIQKIYGVENVFQAKEVKNKIVKSVSEKYGVDSFLQTSEAREANLEYRKLHKDEIVSKTKETNLQRFGETSYMKTPEGRNQAKESMLITREKGLEKLKMLGVSNYFQVPEVKNTIEMTNLVRYGVKHPMQNSKIWNKTVKRAQQSSLEKRFKEFLINKSIEFEEQYTISTEKGSHHYDFAVFKNRKLKVLVDCDGLYYHGYSSDFTGKFVSDACDELRVALIPEGVIFIKILEGKEEEGYSEFLKAFDNIDYNKYIEDIFSWCRNFDFPYPTYSEKVLKSSWNSLKNGYWKSPQSRQGEKLVLHFYHSIWASNVLGKLSPLEAWKNDEILKKTIKNRVIYKDFIDPSRVLAGLSVTKVAPRVSIFSPMLAKYLVEKYLNEFSEIFDPCSGFGGRLLGTASLNKKYIGQDINETTVAETNELITFLNLSNVGIKNRNSLDTVGKYECLFTCPPYLDKENWNQDIENFSAEDWIYKCIVNYSCKKYLFVVDNPGKYINSVVETLEYKSHFGSRKEYVVLIDAQE